MMEDREEIRDKLERVLNEMLERGGQVLDHVYLEMMITNLSGENGQDYSDILKAQFLRDWVRRSLALVNTDKQNAQLVAFTLRLLALLMENEWQFLNIMDTDICQIMNQCVANTPALQTASVKLAHVNALNAMLRHTVGTKWLINTKSWTQVLAYCLESQTIYVQREALKFLTKFTFVVASDLNDEVLCKELLIACMAPIETAVTCHNDIVLVDSSDLQRNVMPSIKLLTSIAWYCISKEKKSCVPHILYKQTNCKLNLYRLTDRTKDENLFKHIIGSMVLLNFLIYVDELDNKANITFNQNQFGLHFFNHMKFCLIHGYALAMLSIAKLYHIIWTNLAGRVPEEIQLEGVTIKFENQIITLQLTPIMFTIVKSKEMRDCEIIDSYIMKLFDISTDHTLRVCYSFRDLLVKNRSIVSEVACKSIQGILAMKNLHRDRAVYVFQALSYTLKDFAYEPEPSDLGVKPDKLIEMPNFLSAILTGLHEMVKVYRITWKESIESMCLMNFMLLLLNKPTLPMRIAVQAIKLTQLSVEHFLAPNLALLFDNLHDSTLEHLGPTIKKRLHDTNWEVRDSSLELLTSVTKISVCKFPAFQQHIIDHDLCDMVVQLSKHDSEAFVRASAINCLSAMINVKLLWDSSLASYDLMQHLLTTIHTESEGIVRKEYCLLIAEIYRNHNIPGHHFELIFPTMAHIAVNDLYWEAKINAIYFWRQVVLRLFRYNGVIDGAFPPVTFSKRDKKIVTLTPKEIELRLNLILDELQTRGALGVFLECLNDDCDLQVVQKAHECASSVDAFLRKYDYKTDLYGSKIAAKPQSAFNGPNLSDLSLGDSMNVDMPTTPDERARYAAATTSFSHISNTTHQPTISLSPPPVADYTPSNSSNSVQADAIIETIVSANDINLLGDTTATPTESLPDDSSSPHVDPKFFQQMQEVKPDEYIRRIVQLDLGTLLERRGAWLKKNESFESLLDDLLMSLQIGDANNADCY